MSDKLCLKDQEYYRFLLEGGIRLRTVVVATFCDLVLKSMISFPKASFGIEFSPTLFLMDLTDKDVWFEGFYTAFFMRLRDRERVSQAFHFSLGATVLSYADLYDGVWFFPLRIGVDRELAPGVGNISTRSKIR
jgi:hypothetical protein